MSKVAVVYWSGTGNTEMMATAVAKGAKEKGAEVDIFEASTFDNSMLEAYDALALGCPSMGAEVLEESVFQPMYDSIKNNLGNRKIVLFGSYGWGDGEWMRDWEDELYSIGANLLGEGLIVNEEPDDDGIAACEALGAKLV
ncbi:MAG TPA: flavodoxin [Christensenellaceae bacterium]|jgi:flavodoxin short chain|nr:flavodoxin [Christensenellaceae bacterium]